MNIFPDFYRKYGDTVYMINSAYQSILSVNKIYFYIYFLWKISQKNDRMSRFFRNKKKRSFIENFMGFIYSSVYFHSYVLDITVNISILIPEQILVFNYFWFFYMYHNHTWIVILLIKNSVVEFYPAWLRAKTCMNGVERSVGGTL